MKDGSPPQDAIKEAFGMDYAALEEKLKAAYK